MTGLVQEVKKELGQQDVAIYECDCGARITFPERKWNALRYTARKFGFESLESFIDTNRDCCERPSYTAVRPLGGDDE